MKFWWVLAWDDYYPAGGLDNVKFKCSSKEEAEAHAERITANNHIWDNVLVVNVLEESCRE